MPRTRPRVSRSSPAPPAIWGSKSSTKFYHASQNSTRESQPGRSHRKESLMEKHSKRYRSAIQVADLTKEYPLKEAVDILAKFPKAKFDETIELSFRLGVDPAQGDQMVRGTTPLPNGSGKKVRVIVFTDDSAKALAAGADHAGLAELMTKINEG